MSLGIKDIFFVFFLLCTTMRVHTLKTNFELKVEELKKTDFGNILLETLQLHTELKTPNKDISKLLTSMNIELLTQAKDKEKYTNILVKTCGKERKDIETVLTSLSEKTALLAKSFNSREDELANAKNEYNTGRKSVIKEEIDLKDGIQKHSEEMGKIEKRSLEVKEKINTVNQALNLLNRLDSLYTTKNNTPKDLSLASSLLQIKEQMAKNLSNIARFLENEKDNVFFPLISTLAESISQKTLQNKKAVKKIKSILREILEKLVKEGKSSTNELAQSNAIFSKWRVAKQNTIKALKSSIESSEKIIKTLAIENPKTKTKLDKLEKTKQRYKAKLQRKEKECETDTGELNKEIETLKYESNIIKSLMEIVMNYSASKLLEVLSYNTSK